MISKTSQRIGRLLLNGSIMTTCLVATAFAQEDDIVGAWDCSLSVEDPESGASVNANFATSYDADGSYTRVGEMSVVIAAFQVDISIAIDEAGSWHLVDAMNISETASEIDFSSTAETPSPTEQMMLQAMQSEADSALAQEEIAEIKSLTATSMVLEDEEGAALNCAKA